MSLNESIVEHAALKWFKELFPQAREIGHRPDLAPGEYGGGTLIPTFSQGEKEEYGEVVLVGRLLEAIRRLNPTMPEEARTNALRYTLLPKLLSGELSLPAAMLAAQAGVAGIEARLEAMTW